MWQSEGQGWTGEKQVRINLERTLGPVTTSRANWDSHPGTPCWAPWKKRGGSLIINSVNHGESELGGGVLWPPHSQLLLQRLAREKLGVGRGTLWHCVDVRSCHFWCKTGGDTACQHNTNKIVPAPAFYLARCQLQMTTLVRGHG